MEDTQKIIEDLNTRLRLVTYQRDMLALYARENPDIDRELCMGEMEAERCPYRLPPHGDTDPEICSACILRNLSTLMKNAGIMPDGPTPQDQMYDWMQRRKRDGAGEGCYPFG